MMNLPRTALFTSISLGIFASTASADAVRTVAISGTTAPGTSVNFSRDGVPVSNAHPVLNFSGQAAFHASLSGAGVDLGNDTGVWSERGGTLALVAREGSVAPGTSANFELFGSPVINSAGLTAFRGRLVGEEVNASNRHGLWSEGGGTLALVAREGNQAPGTEANFAVFGDPLLNSLGQTVFSVSLFGSGVDGSNDSGIWSTGSGSLDLVAREGNRAPGTSGDFSNFSRVTFNDAGQTVFRGRLFGTGINASNDRGIWSEGEGSLELVAREGSSAPGTSAKFDLLFDPALNGAGQIVFQANLVGTEVSDSNRRGIWIGEAGSLALVVRAGSEASGTNARFSSFNNPVLNGAGRIAFQGTLTGSEVSNNNESGIWSGGEGSLALVAREGVLAPGTQVEFANFRDPSLNSAGRTAFMAVLTGTEVGFNNDLGLWAEDSSGVLKLIIREGDQLDVDDGPATDFRTIRKLGFVSVNSGNEDGRPSGFNDQGLVAFSATFTDGSSGIFVSNLVAVPEPNTLVLLAMASLAMLRRKARCCFVTQHQLRSDSV